MLNAVVVILVDNIYPSFVVAKHRVMVWYKNYVRDEIRSKMSEAFIIGAGSEIREAPKPQLHLTGEPTHR
ncbi:uncharacterized protein ColSpa_04945 [Colletotrichum spaethianum]|uniref:Uncharacterized protein n=1 Tax=Colletotrichum spaethianum TaxID=700344 RepID=A0AA37P7N0_9PEZI|nr:uncharacterized protein ColSpa_04945 [Colletotrichum spaethianum]GKT44764.1 hypothetical protein ColSpa_04945 [Colletotrichum spaethianum]